MMEWLELPTLLFGFILRIGFPIGITALLAWFLRRLDTRWREEALREKMEGFSAGYQTQDLKCWEYYNCPPERRERCPVWLNRVMPCWEVFRMNGHLQEACEGCEYRKWTLTPVGA